MADDNKKNMGRAALFLTTVVWGTSFVVMKDSLSSVSVLHLLAIRFIGAALIMLLIGVRSLKKIDRGYIKAGAVMGTFLLAAYITQTFGLKNTTPGKNAFLTSVYCVLVPFINWLAIKKKPDRYNFAAAVLCIAGIGLITLNGDMTIGIGDALTLVGGAFFAIHIVITAKCVGERNPLLLTAVQFSVAGVTALLLALFLEPRPVGLPVGTIWELVYLTVMSTALCLSLQTFGQKYTPPAQAAVIMTFESVFGELTSILFYGESLTPKLFFGFLLTFVSVVVSETKLSFLRKTVGDNL